MLLPVGPTTWPGEDKLRGHVAGRLALVGACLAVDFVLWALFHHVSFVRPEVANVFPFTNILPLTVDFVLSAMLLRWPPAAVPWVICIGTALEAFTGVAFIQMSGSSTSYFITFMVFAVVAMRLIYNYWTALIMAAGVQLGLLVVFALEARQILPLASLFASGPMALAPPIEYRMMVLVSTSAGIAVCFTCGNLMAQKWVLSQKELARARSELRRVAEEARLGRLSGATLGSYLVEELLGRGGMGEVYAARGKRGAPREVAIKLLHLHLGSDIGTRARFRREAEVVLKMPADTVARVHDICTSEDGYDYIVMERLRGEDLAALLRRQERLPVDQVVALVERIAVALDAAHALGVVHRDLKPQNVFVCTSPRPDGGPDVRLLDFGVARLLDNTMTSGMTATAAIIGTPGYMAPEQVTAAEVGPPADVFALGAIIYRALTGKPAFPARSAAGAVDELLHLDPPPPTGLVPGLNPDVDLVVALALAKDQRKRYGRAGELAADLRLAREGRLAEPARARATRLLPATIGTLDTLTSG
jgi:predicted Ser/Thr protein kinase